MEKLNKMESLSDEQTLEKETGISSAILKKISENPKLKKAFLALLISAGLGLHTEVKAQSNEKSPEINTGETRIKKDSIFARNLVDENSWREVSAEQNEQPSYDPKINNEEGKQAIENNNKIKEIQKSQIKKELKGYEQTPGEMPLEMILDKYKDYKFEISDPVAGETFIEANLSASQIIKKEMTLSSRTFTFYKKLENKNILVIKLIVSKE